MRSPADNNQGTAIVEFAIVVPFLVLLLCGTMELGLMFYNKQILVNASREGARCAINPYCTSNPVTLVVNYCNTHMLIATYHGAGSLSPNNVTVSTLSANRVRVSITYTYPLLFAFLFSQNPTINAATIM